MERDKQAGSHMFLWDQRREFSARRLKTTMNSERHVV